MKKYQMFLSEIFQLLVMKFSIYLNRRVFIMKALIRRITYFLVSAKRPGHFAQLQVSKNSFCMN